MRFRLLLAVVLIGLLTVGPDAGLGPHRSPGVTNGHRNDISSMLAAGTIPPADPEPPDAVPPAAGDGALAAPSEVPAALKAGNAPLTPIINVGQPRPPARPGK